MPAYLPATHPHTYLVLGIILHSVVRRDDPAIEELKTAAHATGTIQMQASKQGHGCKDMHTDRQSRGREQARTSRR